MHFVTFSNFELHRDAYLYYAQSEHLAWGFYEVPPFTAVIGRLATSIFDNTTFGLRFFPALFGAINIIIIGLSVRELGGRKIATLLACAAYLLSPAFIHSNALFQPVTFNHFFWLLSAYLILVMINRNQAGIWILLGITMGLGFLNKYSMLFYCFSFFISLIFSSHRKLFLSKYFIAGIILGFAIISPNLIWQYQNDWPVVQHMSELRETQLVNVRLSDFILDQILMNSQALLIWIAALLILLIHPKEKKYRMFGFVYLIVVLLLILGRGKSYYSLGAYPILFAFGAYYIEKYVKRYLVPITAFLIISMLASFYVSLSFDGIPLISFEKAFKKDAYRWEDGKYYDIPQDLADMTGWSMIGKAVADIYLDTGEENIDNCNIHCYHYGQAGAVMFYGKNIAIPQPISSNGSFLYWSPDSLYRDYMIWVHSDLGNDFKPDSLLPELFEEVELKTIIDNQYFRENGTRIYLCKNPKEDYKSYYKSRIKELKYGSRE